MADACYIRAESRPAAERTQAEPTMTSSHLGVRRKTARLFEVDLSIVGANATECSVTGLARLRDGPEGEVLALPVRPDAAAHSKRGNAACLVYVRATPAGVDITTTESGCPAQALCGGQVRLQGQRFEPETRVPLRTGSPCFAGTAS